MDMDQRVFSDIKSAKVAHYKRSRNHALTRQMMQHRTDRMTVISSRGYGREDYVTSRPTGPSMQKRRYSIDVTTAESWSFQHTTESPSTGSNKALVVSSRYDELEPVALQSENMPLPNPLRHASLQRLRVLHPPHDNDTYMALEESSLENMYFNYILDYSGDEAWMDDSILNMALECLRRNHDCSAHGIDIINTNLVQSIRMFHMTEDTQGSSSDFIRARLQDKRWIFIPVNDGMDGDSYDEDRSGSHWYLVVVDCVHKLTYYYDSMGIHQDRARMGCEIVQGLLHILGQDLGEWTYLEQWHSPCQWGNNQSAEDKGACGPFVYFMCDYFIHQAVSFIVHDREQEWFPTLTEMFPPWFETVFHSVNVRNNMQFTIAHHRCLEDSARLMEEHDRLHGGSP